MDSLEAFERGRALPPEAVNHGSPINPFEAEIIPLRIPPSTSVPHIWQGFNRSAVFVLDEHIVLKAQKQYYLPGITLPGDQMLLELGLANFNGTQLEQQVFTTLQTSPHPHLVCCLDVCDVQNLPADLLEGLLFFERLDPLSTITLAKANMACRRRWAIELASAFSHLESLGLIPIKVHASDLMLDKSRRLKLVGFGASPRRSYPGVQGHQQATADPHQPVPTAEVTRQNMESAHQRLASCLHYILTGIDPDQQALQMGHAGYSQADRIQWREKVRRGEYPIAPGAEPVADILQDAWALRLKKETNDDFQSFAELEQRIREALGSLDVEDNMEPYPDVDIKWLEDRCRVWLEAQEREPKWMGSREYSEAVRDAMANSDA